MSKVRWHAVVSRDEKSAGLFVYGVRTTGIYCRPGCSSRSPLLKNVEFFNTSAEAELAGFRPCRRCHPADPMRSDPAALSVIAVCRRLEAGSATEDLAALARELGWSLRHLNRLFQDMVGVSIRSYSRAQLAERVRITLHSDLSITEAAFEAGYGSSRAFYAHGATRLGMTPAQYRLGGAGASIHYTTLESPIGIVLAASTARGVCAIKIDHDEASLIAQLVTEFPMADIERDDDELYDIALVLAGAIRGEDGATKLPLDLAGTAFQVRVWEALRTIPIGETRSYSQIAEQIGEPTAVRAVANACGANPTALAIPCHRIVRKNGSLGGYRWGIERKTYLIAQEKVD